MPRQQKGTSKTRLCRTQPHLLPAGKSHSGLIISYFVWIQQILILRTCTRLVLREIFSELGLNNYAFLERKVLMCGRIKLIHSDSPSYNMFVSLRFMFGNLILTQENKLCFFIFLGVQLHYTIYQQFIIIIFTDSKR